MVNLKETPENVFIDECICLRGKVYAFKCGDASKNKLKGISKSQSKIVRFGEYKKCLDGSDYQKNVIIRLLVQFFMKCIFNEY